MAKYKIEHEVQNCIGCSACALTAPDYWEMGPDGKSHMKGSKKRADGIEENEIDEKDREINELAARNCPVNVIHLIDKESGKKIV